MANTLSYVTGATGFVGSHVAELLRARGQDVRLLVRARSRLVPELQADYQPVDGALNDEPAKLAEGLEGVDYVYHVAGLIGALSQKDFDKVNIEGTTNLLEALRLSGAKPKRVVLVSSLAAFGPSDELGRPRTESDDPSPSPRTMYGKSKLHGEEAAWAFCREHGIPLTVVRPPAVYGPRDRAIHEFFKFMARGLEVGIGGKPKYLDLIHGRDLARGMIMAAESERAANEAYYLSDGQGTEMREVMAIIRQVMQPKKTRTLMAPVFTVRMVAKFNDILQRVSGKMRLPNSDKLGELLPSAWTCSPEKAFEHFGFRTEISLEEGLRETSEWYEKEGWIKVKR